MHYDIKYLEDQGILRLRTFDTITAEDVHQAFPAMAEILKDKERKLLLGDLTQNPTGGVLDKGARRAMKELSDIVKFDKIASFGVTPVARMFIKIALSVMGNKTARFFDTEKEAIRWLKE